MTMPIPRQINCVDEPTSPKRKWSAIAPPRNPVTRMAPRTTNFGTVSTIAQNSMIAPSVAAIVRGYGRLIEVARFLATAFRFR